MLISLLAYLFCGVLIGFFAGLFGIGGGIVGIPILLILFHLQGMPNDLSMHMAIGTLFATIMLTSISSIFAHYKRGTILFSVFKKIIPGLVLGCIFGVIISSHLQSVNLQRIFGLFLLFVALQMWMNVNVEKNRELPPTKNLMFASTLIGVVSGMLGLGGGVFIVPYLSWCGVPIRNAVAISAASVFPIALVGMVGYMLGDIPTENAIPYSTGFIYWPAFLMLGLASMCFAPLGVKTAQLISTARLKKFFCVFLFGVGIVMLTKSIQ